MIWMETFCFYCSVRLGVIVSASFSLFQAFVIIMILAIYGTSLFTSTKHFTEKNEQQNHDVFILKIIDEITGKPKTYTIVFNVFCVVHIAASSSAIYGAIKLQKFYLIPYMWSQFVQFLTSLGIHVIAMIILKKIVNLGILIGMTLAGGFYIRYSWAGAVGLFQIIILVNSQKYKTLYGEDPMTANKMTNESNVSVKLHGDFKRSRFIDEQPQWQYGGKIISVIPLDQQDKDDVELIQFNNWHWNELVGVKKSFK